MASNHPNYSWNARGYSDWSTQFTRRGGSSRPPRQSSGRSPQSGEADMAEPSNAHLGENLRLLPASVAPVSSHTLSPRKHPSRGDLSKANRGTQMGKPPIRPDRRSPSYDGVAVYECLICTLPVTVNDKMWSCETCPQVFHLSCAAAWAEKFTDSTFWRCPGCNDSLRARPTQYRCWCKKEVDPQVIPGIPPHSCGQTCGRKRVGKSACPHVCGAMCHVGNCPPCSAPGQILRCYCGKKRALKRCAEVGEGPRWSCHEPCGKKTCPKHACDRPCHDWPCGLCAVKVETRCYCGQTTKSVPCHELGKKKDFYAVDGFSCDKLSDIVYDCQEHRRSDVPCAPRKAETIVCPRSPEVQRTCACGNTPLSELLSEPRTRCSDPIPVCTQICNKMLSCKHPCQQRCHLDACPPCPKTFRLVCICGQQIFTYTCAEGELLTGLPRCENPCLADYDCKVHKCDRLCCDDRNSSMRLRCAEKRLTDRSWKCTHFACDEVAVTVAEAHKCNQRCERQLPCGHDCPKTCHKGRCGRCAEYVHQDVFCFCGLEVKAAPQLCGVGPWACGGLCSRSRSCGHPPVEHECHDPEVEACPRCPYLVTKKCACGKEELRNQRCGSSLVSCGRRCGDKLGCGIHLCRKTCHDKGNCEDQGGVCFQKCGRVKGCGHECTLKCHGESPCDPKVKCGSLVTIRCPCSQRKQQIACSEHSTDVVLACDNDCAQLEKGRQLVESLGIQDSDLTTESPYSDTTLQLYKQNTAWAGEQESLIRTFAADPLRRQLTFKPMKKSCRAFLHNVGSDLGLETLGVDREPHRHVQLFKNRQYVCGPIPTLAQALKAKKLDVSKESVPESQKIHSEKSEREVIDDAKGEGEEGWTTVKKAKRKV